MTKKNVLISLDLMKRTMNLLEQIDSSSNDYTVQIEHMEILLDYRRKAQAMDLRNIYAKMVNAEDESDRDIARIEYLRQR